MVELSGETWLLSNRFSKSVQEKSKFRLLCSNLAIANTYCRPEVHWDRTLSNKWPPGIPVYNRA